MKINLCCFDIGVSQEFLDMDEVYAAFEEMSGKAVAEGVDAA